MRLSGERSNPVFLGSGDTGEERRNFLKLGLEPSTMLKGSHRLEDLTIQTAEGERCWLQTSARLRFPTKKWNRSQRVAFIQFCEQKCPMLAAGIPSPNPLPQHSNNMYWCVLSSKDFLAIARLQVLRCVHNAPWDQCNESLQRNTFVPLRQCHWPTSLRFGEIGFEIK